MKKSAGIILVLLATAVFSAAALAADKGTAAGSPWKKGYINVGVYAATLDSNFRLSDPNLGLGLDVDVEQLLKLDTSDFTFRIDAGYRFSKSRRHTLAFSWFSFNRKGTRNFPTVIDIPEFPDGSGGGTIGPGELETKFNFDIYKLQYKYSFILDKRVDLHVGGGFFIMPIEFGLSGTLNGVGQERVNTSITAPLPVVGLGFDFAITPQWILKQQADVFYLEYENFKGGILNLQFAVEYLPFKHVGFGFGLDSMRVKIEAEGEDVPGVDFTGDVGFAFVGAQLYVKAFF